MEESRNGKLIAGVIYDDIDVKSEVEDIYECLHFNGVHTLNNHFANNMGIDTEDAKLYLNNTTAICAITGYDVATEDTQNLIIPKKAISNKLCKALESVDLGKELVNGYTEDFFNNYYVPDTNQQKNVVDEKQNNKFPIKFTLNGKNVDKDEFIKEIEKDPEIAKMVLSLPNALGSLLEVGCF